MASTLKEVAAKAGVDISTVSRVLAGKAVAYRIGDKTAARVKEAAAALGFRPNLNAQSLRLRRSKVLGLLVSDVTNPFFATVAGAVETAAAAAGYSLMVASSGESVTRQAEYLEVFQARQVDGVLVAPAPGSEKDPSLGQLVAGGMKMVLIDRALPKPRASTVLVDNRGGARLLVEALARRGCKRLALVSGPIDVWTMSERTAGFREAVKALKLTSPRAYQRFAGLDSASGRAAAEALLLESPPPDAIVAGNNRLLQGVIEALVARGVAADAIALGAFDGLPLLALSPWPVTVVQQPAAEIGRAAVSALLELIEGGTPAARPTVLPVTTDASGGWDGRRR